MHENPTQDEQVKRNVNGSSDLLSAACALYELSTRVREL